MNSDMRGRLTDSGKKSINDTLDEDKCSGVAKLFLFLPLAVVSSCSVIQQRHCGMKLQLQNEQSYLFYRLIQGTVTREPMK